MDHWRNKLLGWEKRGAGLMTISAFLRLMVDVGDHRSRKIILLSLMSSLFAIHFRAVCTIKLQRLASEELQLAHGLIRGCDGIKTPDNIPIMLDIVEQGNVSIAFLVCTNRRKMWTGLRHLSIVHQFPRVARNRCAETAK